MLLGPAALCLLILHSTASTSVVESVSGWRSAASSAFCPSSCMFVLLKTRAEVVELIQDIQFTPQTPPTGVTPESKKQVLPGV